VILTASLNNTLKETPAATLCTEHSRLFVYMGVDLFIYTYPLLLFLYRGESVGLSSVESSCKRDTFCVDKLRILLSSKWTLDSKLSRRWSCLPLSTGMWYRSLADIKRKFQGNISTSQLTWWWIDYVGRDSSVGLATRYGLHGPVVESRWGWDFPNPIGHALGPTQPPTQWVTGLSWG